MDEKKPKRPRIGSLNASIDASDQEIRYQPLNQTPGGDDNSTPSENPSSSTYQPRQQGYQAYQRREGAYQPRQQGGYQPRQQGNAYNREGGYQPRQQGGYQQHTPGNSFNREGGYQPRQQRGYQNRQQGNYQQRPGNGTYQNRQQGSYQQRPGNGTYQPRQNYNPRNQEGGYQPRQQGGYQPRQQGGYNQNRQQGGYQQRPGGYQPRQQGGYQQHPGNGQNRQNGFNRNGGHQHPQNGFFRNQPNRTFTPRPKQIDYVIEDVDPTAEVRLNKYMANAGICSRREADEFIQDGKVSVNGKVVTELGVKITRDDVVEYDGKVVTPERKCYVLLNKPKDCVTTSDDPNGRLTVLDLVKNACRERIYPVGRLDRNTTGVLLLTNDGDLASKLTHPKFVKKKIYHVWTDKDIAEEDMQRIADGIELEDGEIHADAVSYVSDTDRNQAGIEIHSGRNRIVRRIFEHLGYRVTRLDRVYFAGLTKKNLPRGRWRYLTQEEVNFLRMGSFE